MTSRDQVRRWRKVLVYGMGVSGRAAAELLRSREVEVVGVDRRSEPELELGRLREDPGFELLPGGEGADLPAGVEAVVLSPGVPPSRPLIRAARAADLPVLAEVELAYPYLNGPVVGITGSNGKSTTTALTGALLTASGAEVEVCGNIGVPISSRVEGAPGRIFVTELSSFQLEGVEWLRPRAASLLNISPDHMDRYAGLEDYVAAKKSLFANQAGEDVAVLNADDPLVRDAVVKARRRFFSRMGPVQDGCYLQGERVVEVTPGEPERELFHAAEVGVPGVHNLENAMAATLLALAMGARPEQVRRSLAAFSGLPHRLERIGERHGVIWFDDSKGTNSGATLKSLESFADGSVHLILGGSSKGENPATLCDVVSRKARRIYLIGEAAASFEEALGSQVPSQLSGTLERAVASAAGNAAAGEVVLLSPACASFDQYSGFAERGRHFQGLFQSLGEGAVG